MDPLIVYFSSLSLNTHRFVQRLGSRNLRIPLKNDEPMIAVSEPFVLICPTFAGDDGTEAVPKQVIQFLNDPNNRASMRGVIASGNRNFGKYYAYAGTVISQKCDVPFLYRFELMGTEEDIINVKNGVEKLWNSSMKDQAQIKSGT